MFWLDIHEVLGLMPVSMHICGNFHGQRGCLVRNKWLRHRLPVRTEWL